MDIQLQLSYVSYNAGSYITVEGKQNTGCFYIIQQGKVRTSKEAAVEGEGNEILGPGDFLGVVSVMSYHSQIETTQALSDVILIRIYRHQYIDLIQKNTPVAMKIIMQFSKRLRYLNKALSQVALENTAEEGPSHLFNVGEYFYGQKKYSQAFYAYAKYLKNCPNGEKLPLVKEKLIKLSKLTKDLNTEFGSGQLNRTYIKNAMIFAEGEPGNELFVIQRGSVKIIKIVDDNEVLLGILNEGDIFGEMALLDNKPRIASAVAYSDTNVLAVNKSNFELTIINQPQIVDKITTLLADRIWLIYKQLANAQIKDPMGRIYDALQIQLEKNRVPLDLASLQAPYTFNFGWPELLSMAGLSGQQFNALFSRLKNNQKIQIKDNSIHVIAVMEIVRQAEYYRKMDERDKHKLGTNIRRTIA